MKPEPTTLAPPLRNSAAEIKVLIEAAFAIGVPRDYGRRRKLSRMHEPMHLTCIGYDIHDRPQWMTPPAARAWTHLREAAAADALDLQVVSAFRSVEYQLGILKRKLGRGQSIAEVLRVSAAPGYSEHHSGRAVDVTTPGFAVLEEEFEKSPAFVWLTKNANRFGFRMSYPPNNRHGVVYEPWHWCWHR